MQITPFISRLKRKKQRRIITISAGTVQSGMQCIYFKTKGDEYEIFSKTYLPYPKNVISLIVQIQNNSKNVGLEELGWLDHKITTLYLECVRATLAQVPKALQKPHLAVLNRLQLWKGQTQDISQQIQWNVSLGDAQYLASGIETPVITDFIRHNLICGGSGVLPLYPGNARLVKKVPGTTALVNIGVISRVSIIDPKESSPLIDSDSGPGTSLIDQCAARIGNEEGFDRDGTQALLGKVNSECLESLYKLPWFSLPAPKQAEPSEFAQLIDDQCIDSLSPTDRLATISALTAFSIYQFYSRESQNCKKIDQVFLSGGGAHNRALFEYLKAYFDPVPVKTVEDLGIPLEMRIPLALGLTVDSYLSGSFIPWQSGSSPKIEQIGRWLIP